MVCRSHDIKLGHVDGNLLDFAGGKCTLSIAHRVQADGLGALGIVYFAADNHLHTGFGCMLERLDGDVKLGNGVGGKLSRIGDLDYRIGDSLALNRSKHRLAAGDVEQVLAGHISEFLKL